MQTLLQDASVHLFHFGITLSTTCSFYLVNLLPHIFNNPFLSLLFLVPRVGSFVPFLFDYVYPSGLKHFHYARQPLLLNYFGKQGEAELN